MNYHPTSRAVSCVNGAPPTGDSSRRQISKFLAYTLQIFIAAFTSLSKIKPHVLHLWTLTARLFLTIAPQLLHSWDVPLASANATVLPAHSDL